MLRYTTRKLLTVMALYQVLTTIVVQQVTDYTPPGGAPVARSKRFEIPYLHSYSGESSWENLCQTMKIVLPKNVKFYDSTGKIYALANISGTPSNIGGYVGAPQTETMPAIPGLTAPLIAAPVNIPTPTFMRGDLITINVGYRAKLFAKDGSEVTYMTGGQDPTRNYSDNIPALFTGFINKVSPRLPFTIDCEDAMWLLGQIPTPQKQWPTSNLQKIVQQILQLSTSLPILQRYKGYGINITISDFSLTDLIFNVQNFWTQGESLRKTLARIKHQYHLDSWFRGTELRIGLTHYIPSDATTQVFEFQKNILDDDKLCFQRKDDIILSAVITSHYAIETGNLTKDGQKVLKAKQTQILIYNSAGTFSYKVKEKGVEFPPNDTGTRFDWKIYGTTEMIEGANVDITKPENLFKIGVRWLKRYYYDGLKGSFTTFGVPYVKHGDIISLVNPMLPEMNGLYMVKSVSPYGGATEGLRQEIALDFKINSYDDISTFKK